MCDTHIPILRFMNTGGVVPQHRNNGARSFSLEPHRAFRHTGIVLTSTRFQEDLHHDFCTSVSHVLFFILLNFFCAKDYLFWTLLNESERHMLLDPADVLHVISERMGSCVGASKIVYSLLSAPGADAESAPFRCFVSIRICNYE